MLEGDRIVSLAAEMTTSGLRCELFAQLELPTC